jgi:hypothetical protein
MATPHPAKSSFDLSDDPARDHLLEEQDFEPHRPKERKWSSWLRPVFGHLIVILIYTLLFFKTWMTVSSSYTPCIAEDVISYCKLLHTFLVANSHQHHHIVLAPALEAIQYRKQLIDSTVYTKSPYSGNPSREVDHAWIGLMDGIVLSPLFPLVHYLSF